MLTKVPALESFCLVAALGVLADFLLQITVFVGALTLDTKRIQENRADVLFCIKVRKRTKPREAVVRSVFSKNFVPWLFKVPSQICVYSFAVIFLALGFTACAKLELGLTQNISFQKEADIYQFFNTFEDIGEIGPPAYLVFKDVDYTNEDNLQTLDNIADGLSQLNETVTGPVYSWIKMFQQYRSIGEWAEACNSQEAVNLGFDDAMAKFVKIQVESQCCQSFGICGEQFVSDIIFNAEGKVTATRFRF